MAIKPGTTIKVEEEAYVYLKPNSNLEGEQRLEADDTYTFIGWVNDKWASVVTKHGLGYMLKR